MSQSGGLRQSPIICRGSLNSNCQNKNCKRSENVHLLFRFERRKICFWVKAVLITTFHLHCNICTYIMITKDGRNIYVGFDTAWHHKRYFFRYNQTSVLRSDFGVQQDIYLYHQTFNADHRILASLSEFRFLHIHSSKQQTSSYLLKLYHQWRHTVLGQLQD